jgi:hypothetical protein
MREREFCIHFFVIEKCRLYVQVRTIKGEYCTANPTRLIGKQLADTFLLTTLLKNDD